MISLDMLLYRFGGEEFVIVLELERFRKTVDSHVFPLIGSDTVSAGFAGIIEHDFFVTILDYVDKALYFAKEYGLSCIHSYEKILETTQLVAPEIEGTIDLL